MRDVRTHPGPRAKFTGVLEATGQDSLLDFSDSLGHLNTAGACLGAVEGGAAPPYALFIVEDFQAHVAGIVTGVEDEAVSVHDRRRTEVLAIGPENWARGGACCAQNALGGVIEPFALSSGLDPLPSRLLIVVGHQERHDFAVGLEEGLHVHDQVFLARQTLDRLDGDRLGVVKILQQGFAGQAVASVDAHRIGTAHTVSAGTTEGQSTVVFPLDLVQGIQHTVSGVHFQLPGIPVGIFLELGEVTTYLNGDGQGFQFSGATLIAEVNL